METIQLAFPLEYGAKGTDDDPANPLSRALDTVLRDGKPIDRLAHCYLVEELTTPGHTACRWFGIFVLSAAGRVIFFPGYTRTYEKVLVFYGSEPHSHEFHPDHLTLEKNRRSMHLTSAKPRRHSVSYRTASLGDGRCLWFGLSAEPKELREAKAQTIAVADCPDGDARRRAESFVKARDGQIFQALSLNPSLRPRHPGFLHVAVIVGPVGFPDYNGDQLGFPYGSPLLAEKPPRLKTLPPLPLRSHRITLGTVDLQIVCAWLPGRFKSNCGIHFTGQAPSEPSVRRPRLP